ncbi:MULTISPECIES: hypothetical protein [Chryseobacterium]|uniref:hypothetical protein n=1 Tax=Chryseobacterium TaxID=59732 RepID=UPI00210C71A2|nr:MULTISPECIES: hypothetical protein [Chryseobacterium]MCQ4140891.1 hypothetical protein [Chryseobacterium sp. EO14]WBV52175.1 hypothetical protein PFY09_17960 [Chryseobacterium gambrini]
MKKLLYIFTMISCGDKYTADMEYTITFPSTNNVELQKEHYKFDAKTDRAAKIEFIVTANILSNLSKDIKTDFKSGILRKNGEILKIDLDQKTIDSVNDRSKKMFPNENFKPFKIVSD